MLCGVQRVYGLCLRFQYFIIISLSSCDMPLCYFIYIFDLSTLQGPSKLWDKHAISISCL